MGNTPDSSKLCKLLLLNSTSPTPYCQFPKLGVEECSIAKCYQKRIVVIQSPGEPNSTKS
jgi:hypothetical protein